MINMKTLLYVLTYIYTTQCATISTTTTTNISESQEIENLEKQKGEIYSQINSAIHDTIQTLEKGNDTDAKEGIAYMRELMNQIKEFNATDFIVEDDSANNSSEGCSDEEPNQIKPDNNTDFIGSGRRKLKKPEYTGYEKIKESIANAGGLHRVGPGGGKFKIESKKKKARLEKYLEMQQKLAKWKEERDKEKEKVREYKARMQIAKLKSQTERCPDFGEAKPKTKKKSGSSRDKLPCCRKCCKKSYMGCLK